MAVLNQKFFIIFILIAITFSYAYLPGLDRKRYKANDVIEVKTRKLASKRNLPFDFYSLPFCKPNPLKSAAENLGEVLFGDRILNSLFVVSLLYSFVFYKNC
jgi:transmembrane 9 superfamily protein 2/4